MKFFIAGIMQGSQERGLYDQDYRAKIKRAILEMYPDAEIICPRELYPISEEFTEQHGRVTFFGLIEEAAHVDVLIAYLPEASMGTAIEMWSAYQRGVKVLAVTPLVEHWAVKFISHHIFPSISALTIFLYDGHLKL